MAQLKIALLPEAEYKPPAVPAEYMVFDSHLRAEHKKLVLAEPVVGYKLAAVLVVVEPEPAFEPVESVQPAGYLARLLVHYY